MRRFLLIGVLLAGLIPAVLSAQVRAGLVNLATMVTGTLPIANGGTGQSTATAGFDALSPLTTQGDVLYHSGTNNVRLAKGTAYQTLRMNSGATAPEWGRQYYTLAFSAGDLTTGNVGHNPADSTTYHFGALGQLADPTVTDADDAIPIPVPFAGIIRGGSYFLRVAGTVGSNEDVPFSARLNNSSDISLGNAKFNNAFSSGTWTGLSGSVAAGDKIKIKFVTPAFATNPGSVFYFVWLWVEPIG